MPCQSVATPGRRGLTELHATLDAAATATAASPSSPALIAGVIGLLAAVAVVVASKCHAVLVSLSCHESQQMLQQVWHGIS